MMEGWQQRVIAEAEELEGRCDRLKDFVTSDVFDELPLEDKGLLLAQAGLMTSLLAILGLRIKRIEDKEVQDA